MIDRNELTTLVGSPRYHAALYDTRAGHLDPLAYTRGLATAAARLGVQLHEQSLATGYDSGGAHGLRVRTAEGELRCEHLLLAGNATLGKFAPSLRRKIMGVGTYMLATEPLGAQPTTACCLAGASVMADLQRDWMMVPRVLAWCGCSRNWPMSSLTTVGVGCWISP
jgi:gamma-glutamylputrescine oxidase